MGDRLKGKVAIVTGAGCCGPGWGNGKAISVLFAREGAQVLVVDNNAAAAAETTAIIRGEGGAAESFVADASKSAEVQAMVARCVEAFGRIDILYNNVGILSVGGPEETSEDVWDRDMAVNVRSAFLACKFTLPIMVKQGSGAILATSSVASIRFTGYPSAVYNASKGAINQLMQNIAVQYASKGIRANCVLPGLMNTPFIREPLSDAYGPGGMEEMIRKRDATVPMGKMGDAWDVAYAALFLASDEAKYITGVELLVDGGLSCKMS